jgi:hypothetical protein
MVNNKGQALLLPVLLVGGIAVTVLGIGVITGGFQQLANDISSAYVPLIGLIAGSAVLYFTYIYFKIDEEEKRQFHYKVLVGGVILSISFMIFFFNYSTIITVAASGLSSFTGTTQHLSSVSFPVTVTSPNSFYLLLGTKIAITNVGYPSITPNTYSFSLFPMSFFSNAVTITATTYCNTTNTTPIPSLNNPIPTGYRVISNPVQVSTSLATFTGPTGASVTKTLKIDNIHNSDMCVTAFTLSGSDVNSQEVYYYLTDINKGIFQNMGYTT